MIRQRLSTSTICALALCASLLGTATACATSTAATGETSASTGVSTLVPTTTATRDAWLALGDCRQTRAATAPITPPAELPAADTPLTPTDSADTVLTVTGQFTADRQQPALLTMADLDAMTQVECSVDDRQAEGHQVTFSGVLVADILSTIGADPANTLHTLALNDYAVDLPVSDLRDVPMLLATRVDDQPMSVARYGPLRIIYPTTGYQLDPTIYDPRWIWQLSSIDVA